MNERAINKLRRKFIMISMHTFTIVILLISGVIYLFNLHAMRKEAYSIIGEIIENEGELPVPTGGLSVHQTSMDNWYSTRYFSVIYDKKGKVTDVITSHISAVGDEEAKEYGQKILDQYFTFGSTEKYYYRVADREDGGKIVVFLDFSRQQRIIERILNVALLLVFSGLIAAAFVVRILSFRLVRPEVRAAEQQKAFITNASHELKTPLAVIRANTEVETMLNGENEWNQSTMRQVDRMTGLIQNLVMIARAEENEKNSERREINVSAIAKETVQTFRAVAEQEGLVLENTTGDGLTMKADESQIRQLLTLLIDNAIKYCDKNGSIRVNIERRGKMIRLMVSNSYENGKNVDCSRFFDRFYRENKAHTQEDKGGFGIGLSIAESLVKQYKGTIDANWSSGVISFVCQLRV
uniref:sensor histidine kinase n=1 Tax=Eubacterium cellulosolvens TaxID=29322 RepID=UPI000483B569|nr:HAMP domain-containing sensor histidine kinase [[Eubacterium] cellulosolvens]